MAIALDPILLGHNPFFGIDHRSQTQGNMKAERFENSDAILEVLSFSHELGVRGMMMSTHPRAAVISRILGENPHTLRGWRIYPLVPYLQQYVRQANAKGLVQMLSDALTRGDPMGGLGLLFQGGRSLLMKDVSSMLTILIDQELRMFQGRPLGAVFLHDGLTDLALGLGIEPVLELFRDHVEKKYGVPAGFATKNPPLLQERLKARGWKNLLVMASLNPIGFSVNPSLESCEQVLQTPEIDFVAMNTLAGGAVPPEEAYRFLARFPAVRSVVVGFSQKNHAEETVRAIQDHLLCPR